MEFMRIEILEINARLNNKNIFNDERTTHAVNNQLLIHADGNNQMGFFLSVLHIYMKTTNQISILLAY
jgi:hypothetical protein